MSSRPCDAGFDRLGRASADDLAAARALRDAARRLAAYVTGDSRQAAASATGNIHDALAAVNAAARGLPSPELELRDGRLQATASARVSPVAAAIARAAAATIELVSGSAAGSLRACHAPGCVLYFVKTHPEAGMVLGCVRQPGTRCPALREGPVRPVQL